MGCSKSKIVPVATATSPGMYDPRRSISSLPRSISSSRQIFVSVPSTSKIQCEIFQRYHRAVHNINIMGLYQQLYFQNR